MNVVSIDPGLEGAAAVLDADGDFIACFDLPTIDEGRSARALDRASRQCSGGTILCVIGALAIPVRNVSPAKWKRALGLNNDGETRAIETWPRRPSFLPVSAIAVAQRQFCSGCTA